MLTYLRKFEHTKNKTYVEFVSTVLVTNVSIQVRSLLKSWQIRVLDAVRTTSRSELAQRDKDEPRVAALGQGPGEIRARGDVTYVAWARGKLASQLNYGCSHATTATHSVIKVCLFDYQNYIRPTSQVYIITFVVLFPFLVKCNKQLVFLSFGSMATNLE